MLGTQRLAGLGNFYADSDSTYAAVIALASCVYLYTEEQAAK